MNIQDVSSEECEVPESIEGVSFRDYYVVSREFKAEKEKGVGVLEGLSKDVFNSLFSVGVKSVEESAEDIKSNFSLDSIIEDIEGEDDEVEVKNLEEDIGISREVVEDKGGSDLYKASGGREEFYDEKKYDEGKSSEEFYDELIRDGKVDDFVEVDRLKKRSMLEVAGFRDDEAEKKREEMRRFRMGV